MRAGRGENGFTASLDIRMAAPAKAQIQTGLAGYRMISQVRLENVTSPRSMDAIPTGPAGPEATDEDETSIGESSADVAETPSADSPADTPEEVSSKKEEKEEKEEETAPKASIFNFSKKSAE